MFLEVHFILTKWKGHYSVSFPFSIKGGRMQDKSVLLVLK